MSKSQDLNGCPAVRSGPQLSHSASGLSTGRTSRQPLPKAAAVSPRAPDVMSKALESSLRGLQVLVPLQGMDTGRAGLHFPGWQLSRAVPETGRCCCNHLGQRPCCHNPPGRTAGGGKHCDLQSREHRDDTGVIKTICLSANPEGVPSEGHRSGPAGSRVHHGCPHLACNPTGLPYFFTVRPTFPPPLPVLTNPVLLPSHHQPNLFCPIAPGGSTQLPAAGAGRRLPAVISRSDSSPHLSDLCFHCSLSLWLVGNAIGSI